MAMAGTARSAPPTATVTINWRANTTGGNTIGYCILRREDGEREASETAPEDTVHLAGSEHKHRVIHNTLADLNPLRLTYLDPVANLASGTTYLYRVRAINNTCHISADPTRRDQTGYSFGKATAR